MPSPNSVFNPPDIISNFLGSLLYWLVIGLISVIVAQYKKKLAPFIYKYLGSKIAQIVQKLFDFISDPMLRVLIIAILLTINTVKPTVLTSVLIFLLSVSLLLKQKTKISFDPLPEFSDDFSDKNKSESVWLVKTNKFEVEDQFGKPAPDLGLKYISGGTNTFLYLKKLESDSGVIECDVYLELRAVFNIVFLGDVKTDKYYMARLDSRQGNSDGFLINESGQGWRPCSMSGTTSGEKDWIRVRLEFSPQKTSLYKNNELIVEIQNLNVLGKEIGMFNEVADVHVDNFMFHKSQVV